MDGVNPLPDENLASGSNRNEPARPRVQHEARAEHLWNATSGCLHEGVAPSPRFPANRLATITALNFGHSADIIDAGVFTRPRSKAVVAPSVLDDGSPSRHRADHLVLGAT